MEFALVSPLFVFLLMGLVVYGGWFWMAQGVQSLAAEGARAAVAGLDDDERAELARTAVIASAQSATVLDPSAVFVAVSSTTSEVRVDVSYSTRAHPLMALSGFIPPPPDRITRAAAVRIGGY